MNIREANYKIEKLNNELERLLRDKELLEVMVTPKSTDTTKIAVDGGKREDRLLNYADYIESKELDDLRALDKNIIVIQDRIKNLEDWIEKELKILKKYDKVEQLIVYYKEECKINYTWLQISQRVHYSMSQCKKIYKKYKEKRNI